MKWFHLVLDLLCIFVFDLEGGIEAKALNNNISISVDVDQVRLDAATENEAIKSAEDVLKLYDEVLDRVVPWKAFNDTLAELDKYKKNYLEQSILLIDEIKVLLKNGIDAYYRASEFIFEWCDQVIPLLTAYIELFDDHTAEKARTQKDLLVEMLAKGVTEMEAAQNAISESSVSFNGAVGKLTVLNSLFQFELNERSSLFQTKVEQVRRSYRTRIVRGRYGPRIVISTAAPKYFSELKAKMKRIQAFYDHLESKVEQAFHDVDATKHRLDKEILEIGDLKVQTREINSFVDLDFIPYLRDILVRSAQNLIDSCNNYRRKHAEKAK